MEEDRFGIVELHAHEALAARCLLRATSRVHAHEVLLELHDVSEAGGERIVGRSDVVADVDEGLLDPERVERVIAGVAEPEVCSCLDDGVVDVHGELGKDVQLPPSSPTNEARIARAGALPTWISLAEKNGKFSFERSAEVSRESRPGSAAPSPRASPKRS